MEYFRFDPKQSQTPEQQDALIRAWNACAETACPKCRVQAWQYCRNGHPGAWRITRYHRPRQDASGAAKILAKAGIHGLSWAKQKGTFAWKDHRVPKLAAAHPVEE